MAKEIAIGKRAKISEAQQYMIMSVFGASLFLGVAISLTSHFIARISFNTKVIMAEEAAIVEYSNTIKDIGICKKPRGSIYSDAELRQCDPDAVQLSDIPDTLRANILQNLAANEALNSVAKEDGSGCLNAATGRQYTYKEINEIYAAARTTSELQAASQLIKTCSALRVIPDALPAYKNEEALLASLNKLFLLSDWEPETLSPSGNTESAGFGQNLNAISVSLSVESSSDTTMRVLSNIERSIREFDIKRATIEWGGSDSLVLNAQATAYYTDASTISESPKVIKVDEGAKK